MTFDLLRTGRFLAIAALLWLALGIIIPTAPIAQTSTVSINAGDPTVIASATNAISLKEWPKFGAVSLLPRDPADAKSTFKLRYTADATREARLDKLTYLVEGETPPQAHEVLINIAPGTVGFAGPIYEESFKAIFLLFILAVLLESALALVFNWRPFAENLVPRAVRPVIAFVVAIIFVRYFDLDIATALVNAIGPQKYASSATGQILTAMVIAGGSAGVNTMLVALGFRQVRTPEKEMPKPPANQAWLSVRAVPGEAVGDLYVYVGEPPAAGAAATRPPLLGVIKGRSVRNFFSSFVPDRGRLPSYGGHTVDLNKDYIIKVEGRKDDGTLVSRDIGPTRFADRAFVDIDVKV